MCSRVVSASPGTRSSAEATWTSRDLLPSGRGAGSERTVVTGWRRSHPTGVERVHHFPPPVSPRVVAGVTQIAPMGCVSTKDAQAQRPRRRCRWLAPRARNPACGASAGIGSTSHHPSDVRKRRQEVTRDRVKPLTVGESGVRWSTKEGSGDADGVDVGEVADLCFSGRTRLGSTRRAGCSRPRSTANAWRGPGRDAGAGALPVHLSDGRVRQGGRADAPGADDEPEGAGLQPRLPVRGVGRGPGQAGPLHHPASCASTPDWTARSP